MNEIKKLGDLMSDVWYLANGETSDPKGNYGGSSKPSRMKDNQSRGISNENLEVIIEWKSDQAY